MTVVPMPVRGEWFADPRSGDGPGDRALRASWHAEQGCVVLSTWKDSTCTGSARLTPEDAARLVALLAQGLAELAGRSDDVDLPAHAQGG